MFSKELFSSFIFSLPDKENTENNIIMTSTTGINVTTDRCCDIIKRYTARKIIDLINTVFLDTEIIERECIIRLT